MRVAHFVQRYPPALDKGSERKISQKRLTSILEETFERAIQAMDKLKSCPTITHAHTRTANRASHRRQQRDRL